MGRVDGKVALITGAGSGMGKATAELFGREGARVVVANRNAERGEATAEAIRGAGGEAKFVQYDQAKGEAEIRRMVEEAVAAYGQIDILHNHAGTLDFERDGPLHTVSEDLLDFYCNLNIKGVMLVGKWVLRHMIERNVGSIVLTASDTALMGIPGAGCGYTASKAAIVGLTRVMAATYAANNIRVNAIAPGFVYGCQMTDPFPSALIEDMRQGYLIKSLGLPLDAAYAVLYLASDEARFLTGVILPVDGGHSVA
jgi:NAD(P)-dependent dehydrogenase (short-subunit alcohol dehydrogenase family)